MNELEDGGPKDCIQKLGTAVDAAALKANDTIETAIPSIMPLTISSHYVENATCNQMAGTPDLSIHQCAISKKQKQRQRYIGKKKHIAQRGIHTQGQIFTSTQEDQDAVGNASTNTSEISAPWPPQGIKWYYSDKSCCIALGDCREILPQLPKVDLVLTDPPWITSKSKSARAMSGKGVAKQVNESCHLRYGEIGEFSKPALEEAFIKCDDMLVICGFKELDQVISVLRPIRGCFIWHKPNGALTHAYPTPLDIAYIVWGSIGKSNLVGFQHWRSGVFSYSVPTAGCISNGERILTEENGPAAHPCQGPINLYLELIKPKRFQNIIDPFMGSGTTLRAAKDLGRKAIGIEIEEKYCEIAARRLAQEVFAL